MKNHQYVLADAAIVIAARGARDYLHEHNLTVVPDLLRNNVQQQVKLALPQAISDAKATIAWQMPFFAFETFISSMVQAGIAAAKEAAKLAIPDALPVNWEDCTPQQLRRQILGSRLNSTNNINMKNHIPDGSTVGAANPCKSSHPIHSRLKCNREAGHPGWHCRMKQDTSQNVCWVALVANRWEPADAA